MVAVAPIVGPRRAIRARGPVDLEQRLVAQASAPAALRRALSRVAGRMVATRGWERLGFARLGDYAVERGGISARELRDLAAVDRALAELPALDAAFCTGAIGWTQLRLLCRVATADDQAQWLALAMGMSARALAREVRAVDRRAREPFGLESESDDEVRAGVVLRLTPRARARWWSVRKLAQRVAGHPLSHRAFAELLAAEVLSGIPLDDPCAPELPADPGPRRVENDDTGAPSPSATLPLPRDTEADALERGLASADAFELDRSLRLAVRLEARRLARVAALLCDVVAWGLHRDLGFRGVDDYAEERLGMAASRARALLRIERAARICPPLRRAFAEGRLSWVQAHALMPLLLEPGVVRHRGAWIAHAQRVSVRRLGDDVERALALGGFAPPPLDPAGLQTGAITRLGKESERLFFSAPLEVAQLFRAVLATVQRQLERIRGRPCRASDALEAMLDHVIATWRTEEHARRDHAVFERDGWRCTAVCAWHHQRGIHAHVMRCTGVAPDGLRFELGLRSGGPPLAVYGSGEVRMA